MVSSLNPVYLLINTTTDTINIPTPIPINQHSHYFYRFSLILLIFIGNFNEEVIGEELLVLMRKIRVLKRAKFSGIRVGV